MFTIESISTLLEQFGGAGGDPGIQMWTLICLLKLSEPLMIICRYFSSVEDNSVDIRGLELAWQKVWNILLSSELRDVSYTLEPTPLSHGDIVLMMFTEIMRCSFTDFEYISKNLAHGMNLSSFIRTNNQNSL